MARPGRLELPTLCLEVRSQALLKSVELCGFYLLSIEAVAADLLVFVEFLDSMRRSQLRNRLQKLMIPTQLAGWFFRWRWPLQFAAAGLQSAPACSGSWA